jgi:hypothetical protein
MKEIVNGITYDTETAKALAIFSNGQPMGSSLHFREMLYITDNGEYFIHGSGGLMTCYAKQYNGSGEEIIPLTEGQAKEWTKQWCGKLTYSHAFRENAE